MNTILELFSSKLAYDRGKETGLIGLIGITVAIACVAFWQYIRPVLDFFGIMGFLDNAGLIYHGEAGMTWFRLFTSALAVYAIAIIVFVALLILVAILAAFSKTKIADKLAFAFTMLVFLVILSPLLLALIPCYILLGIIEGVSFLKGPQAYMENRKEKKRLKKKNIELDLTRTVGIGPPPPEEKEDIVTILVEEAKAERAAKNGETYIPKKPEKPAYKEHNEITFDEAYHRLNRLPMYGDYRFLVGVTYDRRFFMLLPKPLNLAYPRTGMFYAQEIFMGHKILTERNKNAQSKADIYELVAQPRSTPFNLEKLNFEEFEHYFDIGDAPVYVQQFRNLRINKPYEEYVKQIQFEYFLKKNILIERLMDPKQKDEYTQNLNELNALLVGNDEIVQMTNEEAGCAAT